MENSRSRLIALHTASLPFSRRPCVVYQQNRIFFLPFSLFWYRTFILYLFFFFFLFRLLFEPKHTIGWPFDQPVHVQLRIEKHHHIGRTFNSRRDLPGLSSLLASGGLVPLLLVAFSRHHPSLARHPGIAPVSYFAKCTINFELFR